MNSPKPNYDLMHAQQDFKYFYDKNLRGKYQELEPVRRQFLHKFIVRLTSFSLLFLLTYLLCYADIIPAAVYEARWFINIFCFLFILAIVLIKMPVDNYCHKTKSTVMRKILSFWGNFAYKNSSSFVRKESIKKSELFNYYNREETDDSFCGEYKKTSICVSEHDLRIHGNKGDTIIFRGIFILLEFNKKFKGQTVVKSKWRNLNFFLNNPAILIFILLFLTPITLFIYHIPFNKYALFSFAPLLFVIAIFTVIYLIYRYFHPKTARKKIILEKTNFLRRWNVYSSDQIEARYILTPLFMEKIDEVRRLFHGKFIDFSFFNNKLLIAVHTRKDMFETTSLFSSALRYEKVREVVSQLHSIFAVIDTLDLVKDKTSHKVTG